VTPGRPFELRQCSLSDKLQSRIYLYSLNNFKISDPHFKPAQLYENIFRILSFLHTQIVNQTAFVVS